MGRKPGKICSRCGRRLPADRKHFYYQSKDRKRLQPNCIACEKRRTEGDYEEGHWDPPKDRCAVCGCFLKEGMAKVPEVRPTGRRGEDQTWWWCRPCWSGRMVDREGSEVSLPSSLAALMEMGS